MYYDIGTIFLNLLMPMNLLMVIGGTFIGILIGAIPGLTATMGVALFIPLTFSLPPETGLLLLAAVYGGAVYGGSITAILIKTPGTPDSVFTALDGYGMTRKGLAGKALAISAISSATGGIIGNIFLLLLAPPLANFAVKFGPPELFLTTLIGVNIIAGLVKGNSLRGFISAGLGLLLATVGADNFTGSLRFTFRNMSLFEGIPLVPLVIGLFSAAQVFMILYESRPNIKIDKDVVKDSVRLTWKEYVSMWSNMIKSSIVGTIVGIIPGAGMTIACGISYNEAKRVSKHPETFGHGEPQGLCASETANNAVVSTSLIPLLTLSIPGNGTAAVFLGGLLIHGLRPGMDLFTKHANVTYTLIYGFFICNIIMLLLGLFASKRIAHLITKIPNKILASTIMVFCVIGSYAIRNNLFDVVIMLVFGVVGFFFERRKFPVAPFVLAFVLGSIIENEFRRSLQMTTTTLWDTFSSPIAIILIALNVIFLVAPYMGDIRKRLQPNQKKGGDR